MLKKSLPIKSNLFRFITFRSPEKLTIETKGIRFVLHPDLTKSKTNKCPVPSGKDTDRDVFDRFIAGFKPFTSLDSVEGVSSEVFMVSNKLFRQNSTLEKLREDGSLKEIKLTQAKVISLFDQLFVQVILRDNALLRQHISQMLVINHVAQNIDALIDLGIKKLTDVKIEIPYQVIDCFKPWLFKDCGGTLEGVQNLGIADFRRVEQEVCCYVPGEVSRIENVMAREYKERSTRNFVRTENTVETTRESEVENLSDTTTSTRNEMSSEIADVIEQDKNNNYGGSLGVSANYGKTVTIDVNAYADFSSSNSSSYSNTQARNRAEELTERALERITQRTSERRTSKIIKEFEENNKHGYDNREGTDHVTGVYRWIDIIYTNSLVNYGKRLMVEFMVPDPSEFYKRILKFNPNNNSNDNQDELDPPTTLASLGINDPKDVNIENAFNAGAYFGVNINSLPASVTTLTKTLAPLGPVSHTRSTQTQGLAAIVVPPDYEADIITGSYTYQYRANSASSSAQAFCNFNFGGNIVASGGDYSHSKKNKTVSINLNLSPNLGGSVPVGVSFSGVFSFHGAIQIKCVLKASVISDWQTETYNKLLSAYNEKLAQYEQAQLENELEEEAQGDEQESSDPRMNRIIEQRELKRICIEMLIKPYCLTQGNNYLKDTNACDLYQIPQVDQTSSFSNYASMVKFFEQAIDWQLMSYLFYPYYWADKCDWGELMQSKHNDPVFQAFLQSGMSRVVVPIREQYMEAFAFYLETGDIWLGNDLIAGSPNDLSASVIEDMQTVQGKVEDVWETRVPTALNIIQGKSAYLEEEGLPCCKHVENDDTTNNISNKTNLLGIINDAD